MNRTILWGGRVSALVAYLYAEMKKRGWSQAELALQSGLSRSTLNNILHSEDPKPEIPTLDKLAGGLDVPSSRLAALAGYPVENLPAPEEKYIRMARAIQAAPRLEAGFEKWLDLDDDDQEAALAHIEYLHSRRRRRKKERKSRQPKE